MVSCRTRDLRGRGLLLVLRGVEHSCPHHLEGVTTSFTVLVLGQSVDGLRVSVGDGHVRLEVGHDLFAPVAYSPDQIAPDFPSGPSGWWLSTRRGGFCPGRVVASQMP